VQTDVYFDDVKMTYTPTNILQSNEYYPFGLQTANSWTRDNTTNNFLYNSSSELNTTTAMYDLPFRNYDAALGRFFQVDPLAHTSSDLTPYHYANNNPVAFNDPSGAVVPYYAKPEDDPRNWRMTITNGLCFGDGWSFSFTPGNGGSAAASLDEAANVSQYWIAVNEARLAANLAKANSDGVMLIGAAAQSFFNAWKKSEWVMIDQKGGAVTLYYQLTQGVSLLAFNGRLGDYLTQSGTNDWIPRSLANAFFGSQMKKYGDKIDWKVDLMIADGATRRLDNGRIEITIAVKALLDPTLAYLTVGHELIHAEDYLNGNYDSWYTSISAKGFEGDLLGYMTQMVAEYHAYSWDANLESQFRVNYGAQDEFKSLTANLNDYGLMYLFNK